MGKLFAFKNRTGLFKQSESKQEFSQKKQMDDDGLYRQFFENSAEGMYRVSPEGKVIIANPAVDRIFGYESPEELTSTVTDVASQIYANPADRERAIAMLQRDGFVKDFEIQSRRKDGSLVWIMTSAHAVRDAQGNILFHQGNVKDITEIKKAHFKLAELENKFRTIADFTYDWENWIDAEGKLTWISPSVERITGYSVSECMEMPDYPMPMVHPEDRERCREAKQMANEMPINDIEFRIIKKNGALMWGAVSTNPVMTEAGYKTGHRSSIRDITERKLAEEALRLSEFHHRQLYESMMDGFVSGNLQGYAMNANDTFLKMIGYSRDELPGINYKKITHEKWHDLEDKIIREQILIRGYSDIFEKEYICKDGTIIPVELRTALLRDSEGKPIGFWSIVRDTTGRKKAEQKLRESEEKYRRLHDSMMDGFVQFDMKGQFIDCNEPYLEMLSYTPEEIFDVSPKDITPEKWCTLEEFLLRKQLLIKGYTDIYEKEYLRKDGTILPVEVRSALLRDEEGNPASIWSIVRDITDRKLEEERKAKSAEMHRLIIESVKEFVALVDKQGTTQHVSNSKEVLGYEPEELRNIRSIDVVNAGDFEIITNLFRESIRKGWREITFEARLLHKKGHYVLMEIIARSLNDEEGKFVGNVFTGRAIIKRKNYNNKQGIVINCDVKEHRLTERESEIIKWIMNGKSTWDISKILHISESTVKFHVDHIMKKFNAVNRAHAVALYLQNQDDFD